MGSQYLWKPRRTLRMACRDIAGTNSGFRAGDCDACPNRKLCAIYDGVEEDQTTEATKAGSCERSDPITASLMGKTAMKKARS
jgi:hypothetical protein